MLKVRVSYDRYNECWKLYNASNEDLKLHEQIKMADTLTRVKADDDNTVIFLHSVNTLYKIVNCEPLAEFPDEGYKQVIGNLEYECICEEDMLDIVYNDITYTGILMDFTGTIDIEGNYVDAVQVRVEGDDTDTVFPLYAVTNYAGEYEEPILCVICEEPGDYCAGHGYKERQNFGDCPICGEETYDCLGHTNQEIVEHHKMMECVQSSQAPHKNLNLINY